MARPNDGDHPVTERTYLGCSESALGGCTYPSFLKRCISKLRSEKIIQCSPRGKRMEKMLCTMENMESNEHLANFSVHLIQSVYSCITSASQQKLPSAAQGTLWTSFHQMRCGNEIQRVWTTFVMQFPDQTQCRESRFVLQLLIDRTMKMLLENKAKAEKSGETAVRNVQPLTSLECNAVRYMAGYVAIKLLKKYRKKTTHPELKKKYKFFVDILVKMKAPDLPGFVDTVYDYTRLWSELVDRGGLYHVNDQVYLLMEAIELDARRYLDVLHVHKQNSDVNIKKLALDSILSSSSVLEAWEGLAGNIPAHYEKYSLALLGSIADLWLNIRGHSFARGWTMRFEAKYKKGTRKTLQPQKEL